MSNVPEMSFFEAFRFIDSLTGSVVKLREAARVIQKDGSDLKLWEEKAKVVKDKINAETYDLESKRITARDKHEQALRDYEAQEAKAAQSIQPTLDKAAEAKEALARVTAEYGQERASAAAFVEYAAAEKEKITAEANAAKESIRIENKKLIDAAEARLLEITTAIDNAKSGIKDL